MRKIRNATKAAVEADGRRVERPPGRRGRSTGCSTSSAAPGKLAGAGFYDYEDGKRDRPVAGPARRVPPVDDPSSISLEDIQERMLFAEALETVKCLDEGVIESVADANIGSIMGIGFPGWTGGVLQYINGYEGGVGRASSPARGSWPTPTASASSRPPRWSRRPSAARSTPTTRSRSPA